VLIATPAAVAVWSGWVGLGTLCGFGLIHPFPGFAGGVQLNTAITLPIGTEAYGAYALGAWLTPANVSDSARAFGKRSAIGALALGMLGQVIYHLLAAAHSHRAPWPVVVLVSCVPVVTLGFGAALTHLLRSGARPDSAPGSVPPGRADRAIAADGAAVPPEPRRPDLNGPPRPERATTMPSARNGSRAAGASVPPGAAWLDEARAAYRASVTAGEPMSARSLAAAHGISRRQAGNIVGAEQPPALKVVREGAAR
jgi:hypothetical protein